MKNLTIAAAMIACGTPVLSATAIAQEDAPPHFRPVELYACNYRERKDQDDFDRALELMVATETTGDPYAGFRLFPNFVGPEQDFDFIYFGVWADGSSMGRDTAMYNKVAVEALEAWSDAADCPAPAMFASHQIKEGSGASDDGTFMLAFQDCTVAEGRTNGQAVDALRNWAAYRNEHGSPGGMWVWFPVYGGGDADYTFKLINGHSGPEALGNLFSWMVDNAAYTTLQEMTQGLVSCDVARTYYGETIMNTFADG